MDDFVSCAFSCLIGAGIWAISPEAREPIPETPPTAVVESIDDADANEVSPAKAEPKAATR